MYASNEDEFNSQDGDWIYLKQTPPENTVLDGAVSLVDDLRSKSSPSSSSSTTNSNSVKSDRSDSLSSLSSIEHEHTQMDDHVEEPEHHMIMDSAVLNSVSDNNPNQNNNNHDLLLTGEIKDNVSPSETFIKQHHDIETTPVINEYDLFNSESDFGNETVRPLENIQTCTGASVQPTEIVEQSLVISERQLVPAMMYYPRCRKNNAFLAYAFLILILVLQLIFIRMISSQRFMIHKLSQELEDTNKRLDEISMISTEDIEEKLTKQFDQKFQIIINQKILEHKNEKRALVSQIDELIQKLNRTQTNLTNNLHNLFNENEKLQEKIAALEYRMQLNQEKHSKAEKKCTEKDDSGKSPSSFDELLSNFVKQTASIAENTSQNLSGFFETLSASLSDLVENRHDFVEQSKQKLADISRSETAEKVQNTLRRGFKHLSSSIRQAHTTYASWLGSRAQYREQARMDHAEDETIERRPWRWMMQRSHDRERMRHQTTYATKMHSSNKDYVCHSGYDFLADQCVD